MVFGNWLAEVDRVFFERYRIDRIIGGFSEEEMRRD
jgi:hypothetical protein